MTSSSYSAKRLIVEAAEKSGLLRSVAELLWWADKYSEPHAPKELLAQLADAFDEHICLPLAVGENAAGGEGLCIDPHGEAQEREVDEFVG
jgi:hypothetical protein